jgi:hypothetical protein
MNDDRLKALQMLRAFIVSTTPMPSRECAIGSRPSLKRKPSGKNRDGVKAARKQRQKSKGR